VGKGTQAVRLTEGLGVPHISTGDILRDAVADRVPVGKKARTFVESGKLVPDELMGELIAERLRQNDAAEGFVLDGFPRTLEQVTILDGVLGQLGVALDRAIMLTAPEAVIVRRLSGRRVCPGCRTVYHIESHPPKSAGVCDKDGSALVQRPDDNEEVIKKRLEVYAEQTLPLADAYRERGLLAEVDGSGEPAAVLGQIRERLQDA
jgi:adenylate kinase